MSECDSVISYHSNYYGCGVAKFSQQLASNLGVEYRSWHSLASGHPLLSLKFAEIPPHEHLPWTTFDLFCHDLPLTTNHYTAVTKASRIYAANSDIARTLRSTRPDVITAWCPSLVVGNRSRGVIHLLTFGMAPKVGHDCHERLKAFLGDSDYTIGLSCAAHEGSAWDSQMLEAERAMRALYGSRLRVLGSLADDALVREIDDCTAAALFFDPAFRANNTTAWAVLERGCPLVTNLDSDSPLIPGVWDIHRDHWTKFPRVRSTGDVDALTPWTWPRLVSLIEAPVCAK